jgi:hypothetical protein
MLIHNRIRLILVLAILFITSFALETIVIAQSGLDLGGRGGRSADPIVWAKIPCSYNDTETYYTTEERTVSESVDLSQLNGLRYYEFTTKNLVFQLPHTTTVSGLDFTPLIRSFGNQVEQARYYYRVNNGGVAQNGNHLNTNGWQNLPVNAHNKQTHAVQARQIRVELTLRVQLNWGNRALPTYDETRTEQVRVERSRQVRRECFYAREVRQSQARQNNWEIISERQARQINRENCPCEE